MKLRTHALAFALSGISAALGAPSITVQPASVIVDAGQSASISVSAQGLGALSYQWRRGEMDLSGQTASRLALRNVQPEDAGFYSVVVSDSEDSVASQDAALSIEILVDPPFDPSLQITQSGGEVTAGWEGEGTLEVTSSLAGGWRDAVPASNPFTITPSSERAFFRVRNPHPRSVPVVIPPAYDGGERLPLIVLLHGYSGSPDYIHDYFNILPLAASRGFIYARPAGIREEAGSNHFWNATDACCNFQGSQVDDVAFLRSLISELIHSHRADPSRVFLMGHSNGGFMSYRMACEHPELIAGIASLAGATFSNQTICEPSEPVNILQIHGTSDRVISYLGGTIGANGYPGALQTVRTWATFNECRTERTEAAPSMDLDLNVPGLDTAVTAYDLNPPGGVVELWTIQGGGHSPAISTEFAPRSVDWLLAHPKP